MKEKKIFTVEELREKILNVNAKQNKKVLAIKALSTYSLWDEFKAYPMTLSALNDRLNLYFGIAAMELHVAKENVFLEHVGNRTFFCAYRLETNKEYDERIDNIVQKAFRAQTVELAKINKLQKRLESIEKEKANLLETLNLYFATKIWPKHKTPFPQIQT